MRIHKAIVLALFFVVSGCGKLSPDAESELTQLRYGLSNYVDFLQTKPPMTAMANQFYLILDYWNELKEKHNLPNTDEALINNSMYFYKFFMITVESFDDMNPEKERTFEEEKKQGEYWISEARSAYEQIDSSYWKILKRKHQSEGGSEKELEYLDLLSKEMTNRGYMDMSYMIKISGSALEIVFKDLADLLDK